MSRGLTAAAFALAVLLVPVAGAQSPTATIAMPGKVYTPSDLSLLVGTTVTWHNEDSGNHTATADGDSFDSGYIAPGGTFVHTFDKPGIYKFHCTIHRFMKGVVRVFGLVLNGPKVPVAAGRHVVLTGLAPAGASSVALERRGPGGRWTTVVTRRARADGGYAFVVVADAPAAYRATAEKVTSPVRSVAVFPLVTVRRGGGRLAVSTAPPRQGARVVLQMYDRERFAFSTVTRGRLSVAGTAMLPLVGLRGQHVRVVVRGGAGWSDGVSAVIVVPR